jgi:hypothetical protein
MDLFSQNNKEYMDEMKTNMNNDFWHLKNCPHAHLVQHMKAAMVQYWADERGEPDIAKAWMKTYKDSNLSRVLLCEESALRGGMPETNNITERSNRTDKDFSNHKKKPPASHQNFSREFCQNFSRESGK